MVGFGGGKEGARDGFSHNQHALQHTNTHTDTTKRAPNTATTTNNTRPRAHLHVLLPRAPRELALRLELGKLRGVVGVCRLIVFVVFVRRRRFVFRGLARRHANARSRALPLSLRSPPRPPLRPFPPPPRLILSTSSLIPVSSPSFAHPRCSRGAGRRRSTA